MKQNIADAEKLDRGDKLRLLRNEFYIPDNTIYFDGNSLGLLSKRAEQALHTLLDSWKTYAIDGWTEGKHPWFYLSEKLGEKTAPLIGASSDEVLVTGSTTLNLHQLVSSFYTPKRNRTKIVADELNFPSDIYALKSQLALKGFDAEKELIRIKSKDGHTLKTNDIVNQMTDDV